MNLYRDTGTFHKYISVMVKQLAVFFMTLQTCASDSTKNCNVSFNYSMCLTIIIAVTTTTNRPEEPDSWDVIDNLDKEAEQQSFLLIAAVTLSFLESYYEQNLKPVRIPKWEHQ